LIVHNTFLVAKISDISITVWLTFGPTRIIRITIGGSNAEAGGDIAAIRTQLLVCIVANTYWLTSPELCLADIPIAFCFRADDSQTRIYFFFAQPGVLVTPLGTIYALAVVNLIAHAAVRVAGYSQTLCIIR